MKSSLQQILKDNPNTIKAEVAEEALDHDDPQTFFKDLLQHGCISGMVGKLIYYKDTMLFMISTTVKLKSFVKSTKNQQVNL